MAEALEVGVDTIFRRLELDSDEVIPGQFELDVETTKEATRVRGLITNLANVSEVFPRQQPSSSGPVWKKC